MLVMLLIVCEPAAGRLPDQSPLAVQLVGLFVALHLMVVPPPGSIGPAGVASMVTSGTSGGSA